MNFEQVRNANGGYVTMFATVMNVKQRRGNFGLQADCTVVDDNNEQQVITVSNPKPPKSPALPSPVQIGQRLSFYVKAKPYGQSGVIYYNGYWNATANVNPQPPQQKPQQKQQSQSQNGHGSFTSFALAYAKDLVVAGKLDIADMYQEAQKMCEYMTTGQLPEPLWPPDEQQHPDDLPQE